MPYTYSHIRQQLRVLSEDPTRAYRMRRRRLCSTLAGNACEVVTVTSFDSIGLQPLSHTVTASITYGYSLYYMRLQPLLHAVTGDVFRLQGG